jgi:hypothetical protein
MNGQWMGERNGGTLVVELDDVGDVYSGMAYGVPSDRSVSAVMASVTIPKNKTTHSGKMSSLPLERNTGNIIPLDDFTKRFPDRKYTEEVEVQWSLSSDKISVSWQAEQGDKSTVDLFKSGGDQPSELKPRADVTTWKQFKEYATDLPHHRYLFRGQENSTWRLRTSFHRTGRASINRFANTDVAALHRALSGLTTHRFNLGDNLDYAAFLNLVQHHGYPTPLLDWTESPFIAAYFAYNNLLQGRFRSDQKVRIHILDGRAWNAELERAPTLNPAFRHVTILEPLAINNSRVVPQQAVCTFTNVEDIETYIKNIEARSKKTYLSAIDLPATDRKTVFGELDLMGINAGSLFPGLDGACLQVRERNFDL